MCSERWRREMGKRKEENTLKDQTKSYLRCQRRSWWLKDPTRRILPPTNRIVVSQNDILWPGSFHRFLPCGKLTRELLQWRRIGAPSPFWKVSEGLKDIRWKCGDQPRGTWKDPLKGKGKDELWENGRRVETFWGREKIVGFLKKVDFQRDNSEPALFHTS